MEQLEVKPRPRVVPPRPASLIVAGWLSYLAALALIAAEYHTPVSGFLIAGPWFLLGLGLMAGAPSAWRGGLAVVGFYAVLFAVVLTTGSPAGLGAMGAVAGLGFLVLFVACLMAPATRQFVRDARNANRPPEL